MDNPVNSFASIERLCHFQCYYCEKWWTIGDAPIEEKKDWFCPWCGTKVKIEHVQECPEITIKE